MLPLLYNNREGSWKRARLQVFPPHEETEGRLRPNCERHARQEHQLPPHIMLQRHSQCSGAEQSRPWLCGVVAGSLKTEQTALAEAQLRRGAHCRGTLSPPPQQTYDQQGCNVYADNGLGRCKPGGRGRRTLPRAISPLSKKNRIPRNENTKPRPVSTTPISAPERIPSVGRYALASIQHTPDAPV